MLVLFGTGYGMTKETMESFDYILEPIYGHGEYNHLSVRSAVSIILIDYGAKHGGINRRRLCQDIQNGQILNIKR